MCPPPMQIHDVTFAYHAGHPVIDGVTAAVRPGTMHMLIGPNGCGKTTLLKLMLGQYRPAGGSISIQDQPVHRLDARRRAAWISYVPQRSTAAFAFTVRQVVAMARYTLPADEPAVERAIAACDLADLSERPFTELSVGQQQRVLLARALAQASGDGLVMLLDEPTSAMDLLHLHRTMTHLRTLAHGQPAGLAVVAVVQELNLAARYADHIWLMDRGRITAQGAWHDVLRPELLEPVYGVTITPAATAEGRPIFDVAVPPGGRA